MMDKPSSDELYRCSSVGAGLHVLTHRSICEPDVAHNTSEADRHSRSSDPVPLRDNGKRIHLARPNGLRQRDNLQCDGP